MKIMKKIFIILFFTIFSSAVHASEKIELLFKNAPTELDYSSSISLQVSDNVTERAVRKWISKNVIFFYNTDSVQIKSTWMWHYGTKQNMVTNIKFVRAENGARRRAYFEEIKRRKEEERLAEIRKREDAKRAESDRLAKIKTSIENGTFTGEYTYFYPIGKYEGNFVNGKRDGYGKQYFTEKGSTVTIGYGSYYEGRFKNDMFHGKGTYRERNGYEYTGEFIDGERHGEFVAYYKKDLFNSYSWKAKYENGVLIYEDLPKALKPSVSCEDEYIRVYNGVDKTAIKYGDMKDYYGETLRHIVFPDGTEGNVFLDDSGFYLSDGIRQRYYKDFEATVKALYLYKKCDVFPITGRK